MRILSSLIAAAAIGMGSQAMAGDSDYKSAEIVDFFIQSIDDMGSPRGLCIGTAEECEASSKPKGFDMMINFNLDSDQLTDAAQTNLAEFAKALKDERLSSASFVVEGHTDASGAELYNEGLAERRAESVTKYLLQHGINTDKVTAVGMGERAPRVPDPMDPINRRVEMRISLQ